VIRVLVGHRGALVRGALAAVLSQGKDIVVTGQVATAGEVVAAVAHGQPDVAVLDAGLPGDPTVTGLCRELSRTAPGCRALVMLDLPADTAVGAELALLVPRVGLLAIDASPDDLVTGVRQVARGEPVFDSEVALATVTAEDNPLTDREQQVLRLVLAGAPAKEIATRLYLSTGTVRNYLTRIVTKTGARTRIDAIRIAQHSGWI
jgi:two-component system, NarL family, response regulator DesR